VRVLKDEGRSGYTGELRPGFEEMIKFLGGGQADVLIARHHDRLTRYSDHFARLLQLCARLNQDQYYTGGELDLSTTSGGLRPYGDRSILVRVCDQKPARQGRGRAQRESKERESREANWWRVEAVRLQDHPP
jgi:site-specific DNA recombinase